MNIVLCGNLEWNEEELDLLSENGKHKVYFCPDEQVPLKISSNDVDVIICNWFFKYHHLPEFVNLKYIQLLSAGYNCIDPKEADSMGIVINNAKGVYAIPISEFVAGNILAYYKNLEFFYKNKTGHIWNKNRDLTELFDKHVLIIGVGSVGLEIAKRMSGFTNFVYGCNRTPVKNILFKDVFPLDRLQDVVSDMDIVILSIALTEDTVHLINRKILDKMKKDSLIVNVSRGSVINEKDLLVSLEHKEIGGAILDVFEEEPLPSDHPLWDMENVMITPHNSFVSDKNVIRLKDVICKNLESWRKTSGYEKA